MSAKADQLQACLDLHAAAMEMFDLIDGDGDLLDHSELPSLIRRMEVAHRNVLDPIERRATQRLLMLGQGVTR